MKKALLTGFSSGIGFAYAKHLANNGWHLDLVSQNKERSLSALEDLNYDHCSVHSCNLSSSDELHNLMKEISTPDLLIANAGIGINGSVGKNSSRDIQDATYLMFGGVIGLIEYFLPKMKEKNSGRVVIISSIGALIPMPKSSIYAAIKSGIYAYGRSLNEELENTNVSVTVSLPGYVRTNIHQRSGLEHLTRKIPNWMWVSADKVVTETEKASIKGKSRIIPGFLYRITSIFFNLKITKIIWKTLNARK
ncbi:MAG: SDR family NAD(P)-dependent oxidoreductase [Proteobacteria bacterium]|jgi:short-subunit dehydrogenase|nr:SDR family NAD(P)-dependent oxidoreductase [Pseudomonadota bacterium]